MFYIAFIRSYKRWSRWEKRWNLFERVWIFHVSKYIQANTYK